MNTTFFVPLSKRNDDLRMVYGYASTPDLDSQGEIVSIEAIKKALPEYLKFPTIREMHQAKAIGTTKEARIEGAKGMFIGAKIVDADAWEKVKEGVYRGFSIGGKVVKKIGNKITDIVLTEVSLVDSPANKSAVVTLYKRGEPGMNKADLPKVLSETMEKYGVDCVECVPETMFHQEIMEAADILRLACSLCYTRMSFERKKKPVDQIDIAIKALSVLAVRLLSDGDYQKFDEVLATVGQALGRDVKHAHDFLKLQSGGESPLLKEAFMSKVQKADGAQEEVELTDEQKAQAEADAKVKADAEAKEKADTEAKAKAEADEKAKKEAGEKDPTLSKLESMETQLKKGEDVEEEEDEETEDDEDTEKVDKGTLQKIAEQEKTLEKMSKSITGLEAIVQKMASVLESVVGRIATVEASPAAPKTVHTFAVEKETVSKASLSTKEKRLAEVTARLGELSEIRKNDLAKYQANFQNEAFALMDEADKLQKEA